MRTEMIVALDVDTLDAAKGLVNRIGDSVGFYKVGKQLFTRCGPDVVRYLKDSGKRVFLDLKFHDIPNTVAKAVKAGLETGADMVNIHASGGRAMMAAAVEAAGETNPDALLIAVTVLTSMDRDAMREVGLDLDPSDQVRRLANLAQSAGVHGVVASARESLLIRECCGPDFVQVLPGIRPAGSAAQDQKRVMTPGDAAAQGAQFIVVGRPVTQADDPAASANAINAELAENSE
jgi:orotidine-5'-phosphate decarboxylase